MREWSYAKSPLDLLNSCCGELCNFADAAGLGNDCCGELAETFRDAEGEDDDVRRKKVEINNELKSLLNWLEEISRDLNNLKALVHDCKLALDITDD